MQVINATPHEVIFVNGENRIVFPKGEIVPRVAQKTDMLNPININGIEIPLQKQTLGELSGLPPQTDGVFYIVSLLVLEAGKKQGRTDLMSPITFRDANGNIVGCNGFNV